jgi:Concanavalin A-like lectin/glucanases superfamily
VCLGALAWGCSIYDAPTERDASPTGSGAGGSTVGPGGSETGVGGAGGASTGGAAGAIEATVTTGAAGSVGSPGTGGAGGIDVDAASAGGQGGQSGGAGSGGQSGVAGSKLDGAVDGRTGDAIVEARRDAALDSAPDTGCANPTLCALKAALVHRYSFDGTGTVAIDSVGTAHGTVINAQLNGAGAVALAGTTSDQFVDLPNGIIKQLTNATFEVWFTWAVSGGWQRIFDFGDSTGGEGVRAQAVSSFYLTPQALIVPSFPGPEVMLVAFKRADTISDNETHVLATQALPIGTMEHIAVVVDDTNNLMALYHNGTLESSIAFTDSLSLLNDVNNWLGRSQYSADSSLGGTLHEFRIYGAALSQVAVQASFAAGTNPPFLN